MFGLAEDAACCEGCAVLCQALLGAADEHYSLAAMHPLGNPYVTSGIRQQQPYLSGRVLQWACSGHAVAAPCSEFCSL